MVLLAETEKPKGATENGSFDEQPGWLESTILRWPGTSRKVLSHGKERLSAVEPADGQP